MKNKEIIHYNKNKVLYGRNRKFKTLNIVNQNDIMYIYFGRNNNMYSERQKYLSEENLKFEECGVFSVTKEDEINSLKTLISCMKKTDNYTQDEFKKIYQDELKKINKKYKYNVNK